MTGCADCGKPRAAHHVFVPARPASCVCWRTWDIEEIRSVCERFEQIRSCAFSYCANCNHDERCHAPAKAAKK